MVTAFLKLLNLSISASWLVLVVLVLRFVWKRSPKWVNVLLWGIVALRLLLPFSIESALSLIPSAETISPEVVQFDPAPTIASGVNIIDNAVNPSLSESFAAAPETSVNPLYVWAEIAGCVWLIGLTAMLFYALVSYLQLRRRVSVSLHVRGNIYLCDAISSPFILGVVKPRIYLPSTLDEVQQRNVLAHEHAHLARHDHWWKPLGFALLAVYWFNPVLWLAYALLCRDIELACDERVIRDMDETAIKTYSTVLLTCSVPRKAVAACPLAFGEVGVKERVRNALHYKEPTFWIVAASVIVCIVVAVCFLTNPEHKTMKWAKNLRVEDVVRVELTIMPQATDKQYKNFNADEIVEAVALINKSSGRYISEPEPLSGSTTTLYITTADGIQHTVTNNGNIYLQIDGDTYRSPHITWPYTEGDSPLPDSFQIGDTQAADANRFYVDDWSICIVGQWLRNLGTRVWLADNSDAYLSVVKQPRLADELAGLQNAGHAVEESDGYYRCVTQEGLSNTIVYLYPVPSSESCYWVETHWSYANADESEVELQAKQLRMMAESFRVENGSSTVLTGQDEIDNLHGYTSTLLTAVDLDEDGTEEEIFFEEVDPGQIYRIYATDNGSERWSAELGLAHVGWDSYFLYRDGDTNAILRYNPAMFQGFCNYDYELFSIGADGQRLLMQRSVEFDVNPDSDDPWPPDAQVFADEVNALLEKSTLLISTLGGELHLADGTTFRCAPPS